MQYTTDLLNAYRNGVVNPKFVDSSYTG
jgi:hypothetical protein